MLLLLGSLTGCKKTVEQQPVVVKPTPTPVPVGEVLGYTRAGALWVASSTGDQQRVLSAPGKGQSLWFPSTAPDGSHFLAWMARPDGTQDVVRVELNGRLTLLTDIGVQSKPAMKNLRLGNAPAYSPDGKRIAYSFNGDLWIMDASGYNSETLISDGASWSPAFSPDGKRIAYVNGNHGKLDLWVADLESRDTYQVSDFAAYTVGRPQWTNDGRRILLTRCQGDESDLVQLLADTETPLADADVLTRDKASSSGVFSPNGAHMALSSARGDDSSVWNIYSMDATGGNVKQLTKDGGLSPAWLKPSTATAMVFDAGASRPTPIAAAPTAVPTQVAAAPASKPAVPAPAAPVAAAPAAPASVPTAVAAVPAKPVAAAAAVPAKPATAAPAAPVAAAPAKPAAPAPAAPAAAVPAKPMASKPAPAAISSIPAPTQPPANAAPLRLRYKAAFDATNALAPAGLADLKKLAPRVKQYASEQVTIIGPLDSSPLKGKFASGEARSLARAKTIATSLAKLAGIDATKIKSQPYSPPSAAGGASNSIQIYVELK